MYKRFHGQPLTWEFKFTLFIFASQTNSSYLFFQRRKKTSDSKFGLYNGSMYSSKSDFTDRWRNFAGRKCFARSDTHLYRQADICKHTLHFKICINASNVDRLNHRTACYNAKKKEITRAQAGNAWGPSAAHWRTDEIHISDSNLLLETKGCEGLRGKEFVPSLRAAYTIQLPHYVWTNSPKHLSLKHGFNSSAVNGFKLKSAIILCRHIAASSLAAVLKLLYYFSYR